MRTRWPKVQAVVSAAYFFVVYACGLGVAQAALVAGQKGLVNRINTYTDFGSGDVIATTASLPSGCAGIWLRPTDPGFKSNLAILMSAFHTKTPVAVWAYNDQLWPGSANAYCRLYSLEL